MAAQFEGYLIAGLSVGVFLILQRQVVKEIQLSMFGLSKRLDVTIILFALLFLPGVVLHEVSHWLMAGILRVKTGKMSLIPHKTAHGKLELGYVETERTDWLRDALIGAAPLFSGMAIIVYIVLFRLGLNDTMQSVLAKPFDLFWNTLSSSYSRSDFWLWIYLVFSISHTMLPSASDRRAWLPILVMIALVIALVAYFGGGAGIMDFITGPLNSWVMKFSVVLGVCILIQGAILSVIWLFNKVANRFLGMQGLPVIFFIHLV